LQLHQHKNTEEEIEENSIQELNSSNEVSTMKFMVKEITCFMCSFFLLYHTHFFY
jgi:hypothetical protein